MTKAEQITKPASIIKRFYLPDSNTKQKTLYKHVDNYLGSFVRKRIDFIFANDDMLKSSVIYSQLVCNKLHDGFMPSDHFGVMTVFNPHFAFEELVSFT